MIDSRSLWQISPDFQTIEKPVPFSGLKERNSFEGIVDEIGSTMTEYFSTLKDIFGDQICTALSAGFDSRGMLAYLRKVGVAPYVYVYGSDSSLDVSIARRIARDEGFEIDVEDRNSYPVQDVEQYTQLLAKHFYMYDGLGYEWGVFGSGFDMATRSKRAEKARLQLQGGGGEIFRNRWLLTDKPFNAMAVLKSRWDSINDGIMTDRFDKNSFFGNLLDKSSRIVNIRDNNLDRRQIEVLHPFFALNYWLGNNNRINNQYAYAMTPYMNLETVLQSFDIPLSFKNQGSLHSALIKDADPDLARYPSQYGHSFFDFDEIPWKQRMIYGLKLHMPISMRGYIKKHFWKRNTFHRGNFPYFLKQPYLDGVFNSRDLLVSEYVNLDEISNYQMFSRALSAELLLRDIF